MHLLFFQMSVILYTAGRSSKDYELEAYGPNNTVMFPYMASMVSLRTFSAIYKPTLKCGCVIIQTYWVLTLASCISEREVQQDMDLGKIIIRSNTSYFDCRDKFCNDHHVNYYYTHNDFIPGIGIVNNNIGVIQVQEPFDGTSERPISLPPKDYLITERSKAMALVSEKSLSANASTRFYQTFFDVIEFQKCSETFSNKSISDKYTFCAMRKSKNRCFRGKGGPLIQAHYIIGIVAILVECTSKHSPALFTKVSAYVDWIAKTMKDFENKEV